MSELFTELVNNSPSKPEQVSVKNDESHRYGFYTNILPSSGDKTPTTPDTLEVSAGRPTRVCVSNHKVLSSKSKKVTKWNTSCTEAARVVVTGMHYIFKLLIMFIFYSEFHCMFF